MKVAIIADNLGDNAPGKVFRNVLSGLYENLEFDLITSSMNYEPKHKNGGHLFKIAQTRIRSWRVRTLLFEIFGFYHTQRQWAIKVQKILDGGNYDVIVSFMSSTFYASVMSANIYSQKHSIKHICYCVDAVPAPYPWEKKNIYSLAMKRFVRNNLQNVDVLCMTNREMLDYELDIIGNEKIKPVVMYNPPQETSLQMLDLRSITPSFVYAGKMYGIRNPDALLNGFKLFLKYNPNAKLIFIGSGNLETYIRKKFPDVMPNINFVPYTTNLILYYEQSTALIDVNANIDNDVFLSSKLIGYLPYNRFIISESGKGSPVRHVFGASKTILHVSHNAEDYYEAMKFCYLERNSIDFSERGKYLEMMGKNQAVHILKENIKNNEN